MSLKMIILITVTHKIGFTLNLLITYKNDILNK